MSAIEGNPPSISSGGSENAGICIAAPEPFW
jgi:hypothetical protein